MASILNWIVSAVSGAGRMELVDASGNKIETVTDHGDQYLGVAARQDVHVDADNSSTANIAAGATWSGVSASTLGVAGIQVNTFVDQPHTVYVDQSPDGTHWDITDSYNVPASFGMSHPFQATASYVRVRVKNLGGSDSTVTRIQTALCPIVEAVPRALTAGGNLRVSISAPWQNDRTVTGLYTCSTFATIGTAATPQYLFTLENPAASTKNVVVRDLSVSSDSTAALTTAAPIANTSRPAVLPTGGTELTAVKLQTSYATPVAIARGGTASDGGGATAITVTAGTSIYRKLMDRQATAVGLIAHPDYPLLPPLGADLRQQILVPGESILVHLLTASAATTSYIVNCTWTEYQAL